MKPSPATSRPGALTGLREPLAFLRWPFLALGPRSNPIHFEGDEAGRRFYLTVAAMDRDLGLATLSDGDVLVFITTLLTQHLNRGEPLPEKIILRPAQLLRALGRDRGGRQHALLAATLARLANTQVTTNLDPAGGPFFSLLESVERSSDRPHGAYDLILPEFLVAQVRAKRILAVKPAALRLRGLERRLYGWAEAYAGGKAYDHWSVDLRSAHRRAAVEDKTLRRFKAALAGTASREAALPGFSLALQAMGKSTSLVLRRRPGASSANVPSWDAADDQGHDLPPIAPSAPERVIDPDAPDGSPMEHEIDIQDPDFVWNWPD